MINLREPLHALIQRDAIRDVLIRYCRGVDRCDAEMITSAYHPEAIDHHGAITARGEEIGKILAEKQQRLFEATFHHITNSTIVLEDDRAAGETYFQAVLRPRDGAPDTVIEAHGRYLDRFERRAGVWRISARTVMTAWAHRRAAGVASPFTAPESLRGPEDLSYRVLDLSCTLG